MDSIKTHFWSWMSLNKLFAYSAAKNIILSQIWIGKKISLSLWDWMFFQSKKIKGVFNTWFSFFFSLQDSTDNNHKTKDILQEMKREGRYPLGDALISCNQTDGYLNPQCLHDRQVIIDMQASISSVKKFFLWWVKISSISSQKNECAKAVTK